MTIEESMPPVPARLRVLIADDNDDNRLVVRIMLERKGWDVLEAINGLEALELASRELPALILMDFRMPGMDGLEATRRLKAAIATRDIPVVALSADGSGGGLRESALSAGCEECLNKPIDWERLDAVLRMLI